MLLEKVVRPPMKKINASFMMNWIPFWALDQAAHHLRWWSLPQLQLSRASTDVADATENTSKSGEQLNVYSTVLCCSQGCCLCLLITTAVIPQQSLFQQYLFQQGSAFTSHNISIAYSDG